MPPKDIVLDALSPSIKVLEQEHAFRFSPSGMTLARKRGQFTQSIQIILNRHNSQSFVDFWSIWSVSCPAYKKWFKQEWDKNPANDIIASENDWNISAWKYPAPTEGHFDLSIPERRSAVVADFLLQALEKGLVFLEEVSSLRGAAEWGLKRNQFYSKAADLLLMDGDNKRALEVLTTGAEWYADPAHPDQFDEKSSIERRMKKYFNSPAGV